MPTQLELFPKDDEGFDSPYLDARVALNTLEQLGFDSDRISITIYRNDPPPRVLVEVGWVKEPASDHDKDILAELIEESGRPMRGSGSDATLDISGFRLIIRNVLAESKATKPHKLTIADLYPTTNFGERGERGRLNPLIDDIIKGWHREDR